MSRRRARSEEDSESRISTRIEFSYRYSSDLVRRILYLLDELSTGSRIDVDNVLNEVRDLLLKLRSSLYVSDAYLGKLSDTRFEYIMNKLEELMNKINLALEHLERRDIHALRLTLYDIDKLLLLYYQALTLICKPEPHPSITSVLIGVRELPQHVETLPEPYKQVLAYIVSRRRVTLRELVTRFGNSVIDVLEELKRMGLVRSSIDKLGNLIYFTPQ